MLKDVEHGGSFLGRREMTLLELLFAAIVLFIANLNALIDLTLHPEIPYFDDEHLIVGGISAFIATALFAFVLSYMERLRKSGEWMRSMFRASTDFVHVIDRRGRILQTNARSLDRSGYGREEVIGRAMPEFFTPTSRETFEREFPKLLEKGENRAEVEFVCKNGSIIPVDCHASAIRDGKGAITSFLVVQRDISERKLMERALTESEERLRAILDSINIGTVIIDPESHAIAHANSAALRMIGADEETLLGKICHGFICPAEAGRCPITDLGQRIDLSERVLVRADGSRLPILKSVTPVAWGGKNYLCESFTDISGPKKNEAALRRRHEELLALYAVSSAISQSIDINRLLPDIFDTIIGIELLNVERKGGILLVEGDTMRLAFDTGHSEDFIKDHMTMKVGDCLCGIAAKTGEVVISKNSLNDARHTLGYSGMTPHGHVIIPLKAGGKVTGVLYLYLSANAEIEESTLRILTAMGNHIGIALENARLYEETKALALHDPLTGLANRRLMNIVMERCLAKAKRGNSTFSVIMADIDRFKRYNDSNGHKAGDALLMGIAKLIAGNIRESDLAVRYGGEEFLMLLCDSDMDYAFKASERIRRAIEADTSVTISLGVAEYAKDIATIDEIVSRADEAMYRAKRNGRNRVESIPKN